MAESFFATLKNEQTHRTEYPIREHARRVIARYIELRYDTRRRHSDSNTELHNKSTTNT
jgi:putative transposase